MRSLLVNFPKLTVGSSINFWLKVPSDWGLILFFAKVDLQHNGEPVLDEQGFQEKVAGERAAHCTLNPGHLNVSLRRHNADVTNVSACSSHRV